MLDHRQCPPTEIFAAYVSGCLPHQDEGAFESHVAACSSCARRLEEEACLEMRLVEIADTLAPRPRIGWARRWANATTHGVGVVAAAASVLLTLGLSTPWLHDDGSVHASAARGLEARGANDTELLSCVPAVDETACEEPVLIAQRDPMPPVPWTELPEPLDPATCWSEDDSADLVCIASR
jgi:anti-sigma factor RsiW